LKIIREFIKLIIDVLAKLIKYNQASLKYLFAKALRSETINFIENQYYQSYAHIDKSIQLLKKLNFENSIIVDVGGADGTTSEIFARNFKENKIYVFEPILENFNQIEEKQKKIKNLVLFNKALGNGELNSKINIASRVTSSSIFNLSPDQNSSIFSKDLNFCRSEEIIITKLDSVIEKDQVIGIIKLDVQGYEMEVLKGANSVLERTMLIVLEMNSHNHYPGAPKYFEVDEYLRNRNFLIFDIFPSTKDSGRLKEWDSIYINNKYL